MPCLCKRSGTASSARISRSVFHVQFQMGQGRDSFFGLVTSTAKVQLTIRIISVMHWQEDRRHDLIGLSIFSLWIL